MAGTSAQPFSIEAFKKLYKNSRAMKYLSRMEIEQIRQALEEKNVKLLQNLYPILLQEKSTDEEIVRDFVMQKNRIVDDFMIDAKDIEKKFFYEPQKQVAAHAEQQERAEAEDILNNL